MSVVVVGLNHRTTPLPLLEAMTVPPARAAEGAARPGRPGPPERGGRRLDLPADRGVRRRRPLPRGHERDPQLLLGVERQPARGVLRSAVLVLRRGGRRPPVQGGRRAGLGRPRGERDPGPGRRRLGRGPGGRRRPGPCCRRCSATPSRSASGCAPRRPSPGAPPRSPRPRWRWRRPSSGRCRARPRSCSGAGEMGESMAQALAGALDAGSLLVVNRTWSRATQLAARCGGRAIEWSALPSALVEADVLLASTGSPDVLLVAADLESVLAQRQGRPLLIVDIAVPRDVDPAVGTVAGRDPARHGRPDRLGRRGHGRAPPGGPPGRGHRRRGGRALSRRGRPAAGGPAGRRPARAGRGHPRRRAEPLSQPPGRPRSGPGRGRRRPDPGHRGQAAPRTDRQRQSRGRYARRRAAGARRCGGCSSSIPDRPPLARPLRTREALRIATRGSALARWQAEQVARALRSADPGVRGRAGRDRHLRRPAPGRPGLGARRPGGVRQGGAGRRARRAGRPGRPLGQGPAVVGHPRGWCLAAIPDGPTPATPWSEPGWRTCSPGPWWRPGSVRRRAQLAWVRPDLTFTGLRGNIGTRLERVPDGGAVVVAAAALDRLGLLDRAAEILPTAIMLPQVGQGAIGVECRAGDDGHPGPAGGHRRRRRPPGGDRRAGLPGPPGRRLRSAGRRPGRPPGRRHPADRRAAWPPLTAGWCCARGAPDPCDAPAPLGSALAEELLAAGGADLADGGSAVTVYLVGAGPGDPGLLTVRGAELLGGAEVVVHDRLADASLLDLAPAVGLADRRRQGARRSDRPGRDQRPPRSGRAGPGGGSCA